MDQSQPPPSNAAGALQDKKKENKQHAKLLKAVQAMNSSSSTTALATASSSPFSYFDKRQIDDFSSSVGDVLYKMTTTKMEVTAVHRSMRKSRLLVKLKEDRMNNLVMEKPAKHPSGWDMSYKVSAALLVKLRAPVELDASGCVYSPFRDLPRTKEGQKLLEREKLESFKPGETGKFFGEPPIDSCAKTYQFMLERHLLGSVQAVKNDYEGMPWATVAVSELKGNVGCDLASLEERLRRVQGGISTSDRELYGGGRNRIKLEPMGGTGMGTGMGTRPGTSDTNMDEELWGGRGEEDEKEEERAREPETVEMGEEI